MWMPIVKPAETEAFAVWITGLPASGKSTIAEELAGRLADRRAAVLESDALREVFTPGASYDQQDREQFYKQVAYVAALLVRHGVPVIIAATANLRAYRQLAREQIPRFVEVYVDTPLEVCLARDPKGIYSEAQAGANQHVPGLQAPYEPPERPDVIIHGDLETASDAAGKIVEYLQLAGLIGGALDSK
jgi:adenylylsulfate kinase